MPFQTASLRGFKCHAVVPRGVLCLRTHARARSVLGNGASAICWTPRGRQPQEERRSVFFRLGCGTVLMLQMLHGPGAKYGNAGKSVYNE